MIVFLLLAALLGAASWYWYSPSGIYPGPEPALAKGQALVEAGNYEQAAEIFQLVYEKHPDSPMASAALLQAGEMFNLYLARYHEALIAYLLVEKDYPETAEAALARRQVARIYKQRLRDYDRAIIAYQKLLADGVTDEDLVQYEIADAYFRLNNFEQARIEFESLLKSYPQSPLVPEVSYRIAVAHSLEGSLDQAEQAYRGLIAAWPDGPYTLEGRFGLASVLEEQEQLGESLQILKKLKGLYPNPEVLDEKVRRVSARIEKKKKGH